LRGYSGLDGCRKRIEITAYGLLKLAERGDPSTCELQQVGSRILSSLVTDYLVTESQAANRGALLHGCYRYPQGVSINNELIWGDFYAAAALDLLVPI